MASLHITGWANSFIIPTLSEEIAQSTVYHHLRQICAYLHLTIMHKVIGVT